MSIRDLFKRKYLITFHTKSCHHFLTFHVAPPTMWNNLTTW